MSFAPFRAASLANTAASPRCFVKRTRNDPNCERKSLAICGHASPVLPLADNGLTITTDIAIADFRLPIADCSGSIGNWQLAIGINSILFAKFRDLSHHRVSNLFVRPQPIRLLEMFAQVQQRPKMDADNVLSIPVTRHLSRQTITKPAMKTGITCGCASMINFPTPGCARRNE